MAAITAMGTVITMGRDETRAEADRVLFRREPSVLKGR